MLDTVVKEEVTKLVRNEMGNVDKDTIIKDYLFEASFIPYFSNVMIKNQIRMVANESINEYMVGEVVEDMVET